MTPDARALTGQPRRAKRDWPSVLSHVAIFAVAVLFLFPFFWMLSNALRGNDELFTSPPQLLPSHIRWDNFVRAWVFLPFGRFFLNSFFVSAAVTVIVLLVSSLAAYAFARLRFPGREGLLYTYIATLMVPQAVLVIPLFLLISRLGWINTYQALILPMAFGAFGTFLMRQFFLSVPAELEESAMLDGASHAVIFWRIFVPLSLPPLGILALLTFTGQWNQFLWPLIVVNDTQHTTIPLALTLFQGQHGTQWNYLMAGAAISMVPGILLTIALQRYIFGSISIGSGFGGR